MKGMKTIKFICLGFALCGALAFFVQANSQAQSETPHIQVERIYSFATPPVVKNGAVFMTLKNTHDEDDALVGVTSDIARTLEIHTHIHEDGILRMREVDSISIPASGEAVLKPMGDHIMLIGLNETLETGDQFDLTLTFEKSPSITTKVKVYKRGAEIP